MAVGGERETTWKRLERSEDEEERGVRPSSFIAPVEKNVELSNGRCCGNNNKKQEN